VRALGPGAALLLCACHYPVIYPDERPALPEIRQRPAWTLQRVSTRGYSEVGGYPTVGGDRISEHVHSEIGGKAPRTDSPELTFDFDIEELREGAQDNRWVAGAFAIGWLTIAAGCAAAIAISPRTNALETAKVGGLVALPFAIAAGLAAPSDVELVRYRARISDGRTQRELYTDWFRDEGTPLTAARRAAELSGLAALQLDQKLAREVDDMLAKQSLAPDGGVPHD
jgi:hypothetical protein